MIMQGYLLTIGYLLVGAGLLLVDYYGGRFLLLIRIRHVYRTSLKTLVFSILGGLVLVIVKVFFPTAPGPVLLGDLFPAAMVLVLVVYFLSQLVAYHKHKGDEASPEKKLQEDDMLQKTGSFIETNKRNLGVVIMICALLHFLFPQAVLL
ncbi:MAG: hypothetical protein CVV52_16490 [Spirochaetae bacterium HGW-Spirochaetae-8]|jgi:L-lactate permease|nr:MAG: hypothetical protein CVV52_16490 [Spirochaetae bacterium HGW-Spirochaetae-8]